MREEAVDEARVRPVARRLAADTPARHHDVLAENQVLAVSDDLRGPFSGAVLHVAVAPALERGLHEDVAAGPGRVLRDGVEGDPAIGGLARAA